MHTQSSAVIVSGTLLLFGIVAVLRLTSSRPTMDHSHHMHGGEATASGSGHSMQEDGGGMQMWFYNGIRVTLWFQTWSTSTVTQYTLCLLGLVLFGIAHEGLACYRSHCMAKRCHGDDGGGASSKASSGKLMMRDKLLLGGLYAFNIGSGYLLMLAVMTYNAGCFAAVALGLGLGYALFFDRHASVVGGGVGGGGPSSRSESCHVRLLDGE